MAKKKRVIIPIRVYPFDDERDEALVDWYKEESSTDGKNWTGTGSLALWRGKLIEEIMDSDDIDSFRVHFPKLYRMIEKWVIIKHRLHMEAQRMQVIDEMKQLHHERQLHDLERKYERDYIAAMDEMGTEIDRVGNQTRQLPSGD